METQTNQKKELKWNLDDVIEEGKFEQIYLEVETELQKYSEYRKELKPQISEEKFKEIFEFSDLWKGSAPLVVIPTTYYSVNVDELIDHKIKMVIYANQTLRAAHFALSKLLEQMKSTNNMSQLQNQMSSMDDIFKLQEMYDMKSQEKSIEEKLRKLGYIS